MSRPPSPGCRKRNRYIGERDLPKGSQRVEDCERGPKVRGQKGTEVELGMRYQERDPQTT